MTFWDFCAPFYDLGMKANGEAYAKMLTAIQELVPHGASVIERPVDHYKTGYGTELLMLF